ncbi:hypothetical protein Efla_006513 [Eimeria flavescens]
MKGPLGAPGLLGALEETADVRRALELLKTADLVAADAGASSCVLGRWGPLLERAGGPSAGAFLGGPPGGLSVPGICQLEGFKELQRRQWSRQLRSPQRQQEPQQQQQQQLQQQQLQQQQQREEEPEEGQALWLPAAETAVVFVSSFLDKALPSLEALVDLLPSLQSLTLCCFFSEDQQRWHARCMQQPHAVSLQRAVTALRLRRGGGPIARGGAAPGGPLALSVEVLHTPLHASQLSANAFLLTSGAAAPLIAEDAAGRLLAEAAAEERLLQRRSAAGEERQLDEQIRIEDFGAAARLLGRAVAERIPPKSKRSAAAAAVAAAGATRTAEETPGQAQGSEVLLLIVDRVRAALSAAQQQHSSSSTATAEAAALLLDLQTPLASGSALAAPSPADGGAAMLQRLRERLQQEKQQQQQQQGQQEPQQHLGASWASYPAETRCMGMLGEFPRLCLLLSYADEAGASPKQGTPAEEGLSPPPAAGGSPDAERRKQQQQQQLVLQLQKEFEVGSAQSYIESGRLRCFFVWGPPAHVELFLATASSTRSLRGWQRLRAALAAAFEAHGVEAEGPSPSVVVRRCRELQQRLELLLLLVRLLQRTREKDRVWGRKLWALQKRLALWPLLEYAEELLLPWLLAGEPLDCRRLAAGCAAAAGPEALRAALLLAAAEASATGPDASPARHCKRRAGPCCCWECLMEKTNTNSSSSSSSALAERLWSLQQARAALSSNRWASRVEGRELHASVELDKEGGPPRGAAGRSAWLLRLAKGLRDTPGEASAYADAPPANAPLLEGILKHGMSTMSFLWGVAKSGAEAVAGRERLSLRLSQPEKAAPRRRVVVFVLGGVAPAELQAFGAFGGPSAEPGAPREFEFLIGSTGIASPASLASQLFGDLTTEALAG